MEEQEVVQTLLDSGLFGITTQIMFNGQLVDIDPEGLAPQTGRVGLPTADQAEAILAKMGLQVIFDTTGKAYDLVNANWKCLETFKGVKSGQRTKANNIALAWCCTNMKTELEQVINELDT